VPPLQSLAPQELPPSEQVPMSETDESDIRYKRRIWALMLRRGGCRQGVSSSWIPAYGSSICANIDDTRDALDAIEVIGIDYAACSDPGDAYGSAWGGTFGDDIRVEFFTGTLVTNDGRRWPWAMPGVDEGGLIDLVKMLLSWSDDETETFKVLRDRIDNAYEFPGTERLMYL
jgi:hypothetical protein